MALTDKFLLIYQACLRLAQEFRALAIFAAVRRASSRVSSLAADRLARLLLEIEIAESLTVSVSRTTKQAGCSSTVQGGVTASHQRDCGFTGYCVL
jgi:hypothetical protein